MNQLEVFFPLICVQFVPIGKFRLYKLINLGIILGILFAAGNNRGVLPLIIKIF